MTERETKIIRMAAQMAEGSSLNNGVQWAAEMLHNLLLGKNDCPACEGSKTFRDENCSQCGGTGTLDGIIEVLEREKTNDA